MLQTTTPKMNSNIVKIGGSVITDDTSMNHFDAKNTLRIAKEIYPFQKGLIIVHGTGHIGKPPAIKYGYLNSGILPEKDGEIALPIKDSIRQLNNQVVQALQSVSIQAVPIDIMNYYDESTEQLIKSEFIWKLAEMAGKNQVPVFYGDMIRRSDGSYKVISSDVITLILSKILNPENVIFLTDVEGVYIENGSNDKDKKIIPILSSSTFKSMKYYGSDATDVSGGMRKKAEIALEVSKYCNRCFIGSGYQDGILRDFFAMKTVPGTIVKAS